MSEILEVLEEAGLTLLENDQAALEAAAASVADETITNVAAALESKLSSGGVAGVLEAPLKDVLTAAEPALEGVAGAEIDSLYAALETALKNATVAPAPDVSVPASEAPAEGKPAE
jgi:hypothetical protein